MKDNKITSLFDIKFPIIQAGMVWCSGWKLASAVSNAGGLGLLGAGSMSPILLEEHILKTQLATDRPFGVNLPLLYSGIEEQINVIIKSGVKIVFTSAGNPKLYTTRLKMEGITVVHVVSGSVFARKAEDAGCDALVAEGFEAGGHNGREETTTFCLIPSVIKSVKIPVIAAGGIYDGKSMLAAIALGADGVQIGSRFVASNEASAHPDFKRLILQATEGSTQLTLKELTPVRLLKNKFWQEIQLVYQNNGDTDMLKALLGKGRAKKGMFEGDLEGGELEIGQVSANIDEIMPASDIVRVVVAEYNQALQSLTKIT